MAVAIKENSKPTRTIAETSDEDDETEAWYEENDDLPFVYDYDRYGYPISDGQLLAETNLHRKEINHTLDELEAYFADRADVYVAGCDFLYYEEGNRRARISPDAYVVFGVPKDIIRENFKIWEEGEHAPALVIEVTSKKTRRTDEVEKFLLYEQVLQVPEYILFDPRPFVRARIRLRGFRLNVAGNYEAIPLDANGLICSEQLDLYLEEQGRNLRVFDAKTGEYLRTPAEAEAQRKVAELRANEEARRATQEARARQQEKKRADDAEAEVALLRAELEILRRQNQNEQG